jgi:hypothetical protein
MVIAGLHKHGVVGQAVEFNIEGDVINRLCSSRDCEHTSAFSVME